MKLTYQRERFIDIMPELPLLFARHYDEVALDKPNMPLNPAWEQYINLEYTGQLAILTARASGKLVGYHFNLVHTHLHYATVLCSFSDMFFMLPEYRGWYRGIKMFSENEKLLKSLGVKKCFVMAKVHIDISGIMKRLGYTFIERIFSKRLD